MKKLMCGLFRCCLSAIAALWLTTFPSLTSAVPRLSANPACNDGLDNDGDQVSDFPSDEGCISPEDLSEAAACEDTIDNDGDGLVDFPLDPGCPFPSAASEEDGECADTVDNNLDGVADYPEDPGCSSFMDVTEGFPGCGDGVDNDGDGLADFPSDPDCVDAFDPTEEDLPACADRVDNNGDGRVDFPDDPGCTSAADPSEFEFCGNGVVEPGEDCEDQNAVNGDGCSEFCIREFCGDGIVQLALDEECDDRNDVPGDGCSADCQLELCGDLNSDCSFDATDVAIFRGFLADPVGMPLTTAEGDRCSVIGEASDCDVLDVAILRRFLESPLLPPPPAPVCEAALASEFVIGGVASGLGSPLVLQNNGQDDLVVAEDSSFSFAMPLPHGSFYSVSILTEPVGQLCTVENGSGIIAGADFLNVVVSCIPL